eukprot:6212849-Pleurochrysis_carterae.AAC.3
MARGEQSGGKGEGRVLERIWKYDFCSCMLATNKVVCTNGITPEVYECMFQKQVGAVQVNQNAILCLANKVKTYQGVCRHSRSSAKCASADVTEREVHLVR